MGAIEIRGIDHVVLRVSDVERSIHFYCRVLGCREERRVDALGLVQLRAGAAFIDLVDVQGPLGRLGGDAPGETCCNVDHLALQLDMFDEPRCVRCSQLPASTPAMWPSDMAQREWDPRSTSATPTATSWS